MTIRQIVAETHRQLAGQYSVTETDSFIRILFSQYLKMTPAQAHLLQDSEAPDDVERQFRMVIDELKEYRPIQYILGETEFYGLPFGVTPDVLIPRPETEELVDWIVRVYDRDAKLSIVDIGVGSGCIAVSLAANFPNATVWAIDVSEVTLAVARQNALKNSVKVNFLLQDVLKDGLMGFEPGSLDVLVSNPPYVTPSEKQHIQPNVLEYEPHCALFTPQDEPFIFYKRMAAFGGQCLKDSGRVFFEINEAFPEEVTNILKQHGYADMITKKDINGKWRMISAQKISRKK